MNNGLEGTLQALNERVEATEAKLAAQQKLIEDLTEKVNTNSSKVNDRKASDVAVDVEEDELNAEEGATDVMTSVYEFDQSMWDATLLLFMGSASITFTDRVILAVGVVLNLGLQLTLLIVIMYDMLDTSFGAGALQGMLTWRVENGHPDMVFDHTLGKSKVEMLCAQELWSFEQSEYDDMFMYLYKPIPGIILSLLAIVLWVLTCMTEYRHIVEQFLAVLTLPAAERDKSGRPRCARETKDAIEVVGITPCRRVLSFFTLSLPRFGVLFVLCGVGCQYLAQTITLSDIVLNAVALAFVLDVDEALCHVLLSERLRSSLAKMQPISCGSRPYSFHGVALKDVVRYLVTLAVILFTTFFWLVPFHGDVVGAANALCGGKHDFTYSGGTQSTPMVTVKNTSDWVSDCTSATLEQYMAQYYGGLFNNSAMAQSPISQDPDFWAARRMDVVLSYAFKGCPAGQNIYPDGECRATPAALMGVLPAGVTPGSNVDPEVCQRLEPLRGWDSCPVLTNRTACRWSWLSEACEGNTPVPGYHHSMACGENLDDACMQWSYFGMDHPTMNCAGVWICPDGPGGSDCLSAAGSLTLTLSDFSAFRANTTASDAAVAAGVAAGLNFTGHEALAVAVQYRRRLQPGSAPLRTAVDATYEIESFPTTLKTQAFLNANASILAAINAEFNASLGLSDLVVGFQWGSGSPGYLTFMDLRDQRLQAQQLQQQLAAAEAQAQAHEAACGEGGACNPQCPDFDAGLCAQWQPPSPSPEPSPNSTPAQPP